MECTGIVSCCASLDAPYYYLTDRFQEPPEEEEMDDLPEEMPESKDDGYIKLVLKVLASICDGQHKGLQVGSS